MSSKYIIFGISLLVNILLVNTGCPPPYSHCNLGKEDFTNVHIVPHTHDDVGWLKTVDEYYYGSSNQYQKAAVQYILDTVVNELWKDPAKRFVYVEIAFFWRWWNEQDADKKLIVRTLVNEGRLEFVIGAWCMNDEATTYYSDIIDQQTLGLKFILKEFGECARPRSAWQVDPFGHSREQASLFAQFGFDGLFQGRIDYQDFENRGKTKTREGLWQASANLGKQGQLFTGVLPNGYNPPQGFCFDEFCEDDPIMDNRNLEDYNVDQKVDDFLKYTHDQQSQYKTSNLIMTMGSDFQYSNAHMWYKNLDKLIKYVNERQSNGSKVNIFYSTPACYLYSLNKANTTWSIKTDDFFPYAHKPHAFWTGYFTSRATLKYYVRETKNILQFARHLTAFLDVPEKIAANKLATLERAMGVAQHHDAVSGTEKQHVANDYAKRLANGTANVLSYLYGPVMNFLGINEKEGLEFYLCQMLNVSECLVIENSTSFIHFIYNPLAADINTWVRIPLADTNSCHAKDFQVYLRNGSLVQSEFVPIDTNTMKIPERTSRAKIEIVFKAELLAMTMSDFLFTCTNATKNKIIEPKVKQLTPFSFKNPKLQIDFDKDGNLNRLKNLASNKTTSIKQNFCYYNSFQGNNSEPIFEPSGAYVFRPLSNTPECLTVLNYTIFHSEQFDEIHQVYNDWISQTIRLYNNKDSAEFNWQVGPIDIKNNDGKEVIIRFSSDLKTNREFYTDSNGREILKRIRDFRPTWKLNQTEKVAGNYYPINTRIFLKDEESDAQLTLLNDRSQGGSSIEDGSLEVMLHRRILNDDGLGVGEPLNETGIDGNGLIVKGQIQLLFDTVKNSPKLHRQLAREVNSKPVNYFLIGDDLQNIHSKLNQNFVGRVELPDNLHMLTLMKDFDANEEKVLLVRIEHFYEIGEDSQLSQNVIINLRYLFSQYDQILFDVVGIKELALGANMPVENLRERLEWTAENGTDTDSLNSDNTKLNTDLWVEFSPMQIRTFHVYYL